MAKAIPDGFHSVTPQLAYDDCAGAFEFLEKALGAKEVMRMPGPDGKIMHGEVRIGDSMVFLFDFTPEMCKGWATPKGSGVQTAGIFLYVQDVDATHKKALACGATPGMPPTDMFWGDRMGSFTDPGGHQWNIATHVKDMTPEEIGKAHEEFMAQMAAGGGCSE
jgi:uncharacterized glyoxalase superfamily protein PhnB